MRVNRGNYNTMLIKENGFTVEPISREDIVYICKEKHYLKRVPSIVKAYGLYDGIELIGGITFGVPPSAQLMKLCGEENKHKVLELNRLWCDDKAPKNSESFLIGNAIKMLKVDKPEIKILVSYADTRENHVGIVYQATNWLNAGFSTPGGGSLMIDGIEHHAKSVGNKYGTSNINKLRELLPNSEIVYRPRSKKVRYLKFIGNKRENKDLISKCKYEILKGYYKGE